MPRRWLALLAGGLLLVLSAAAQQPKPKPKAKPKAPATAAKPANRLVKPAARQAKPAAGNQKKRVSSDAQRPARSPARSQSQASGPAPRRKAARPETGRGELKTKAQLEKEKRANEQRAREASRILAQTRERKQASLGQLNALQERISVQQGRIRNISSEVRFLDHDVRRTEQTVESLQLDLQALKQEYARTIYAASKARAADQLMFLFAAESFNQFAMRLRYLRQYGQARRIQAARIQQTEQQLQDQLHGLTRQRQTKQQLLGSQLAENRSLLSLKTEQDQVVQQLSAQETQLQRELAERQAAVARLNDLIAARVREELARAAREARLAEARRVAAERRTGGVARPTETPREEITEAPDEDAAYADNEAEDPAAPAVAGRRPESLARLPDATRLSASFANNRARLPWPVERGFVSQHFGRHAHPVLRHVVVENRGIDIQTAGGQVARAIFEGKVLTVASVPGMNTIVMIQHGQYFTVYAKLRDVRVTTGQQVKLHDPIGTVFTNPEGTTELQFQLWRGSTGLNPEAWLRRR